MEELSNETVGMAARVTLEEDNGGVQLDTC